MTPSPERERARVGEWLPIESAPKDGTQVMLGRAPDRDDEGDEGVSVPGFWQAGWGDSVDDMGCDSGWVDSHFQIFHGGRSFGNEKYRYPPSQPTHWMPFPAPPALPVPVAANEGAT